MIYKQEGANWRPCAGAVREDTGTKDKNQRPVINEFLVDGTPTATASCSPASTSPTPFSFPSHSYWGDTFSEEMSLLVMGRRSARLAGAAGNGLRQAGQPSVQA